LITDFRPVEEPFALKTLYNLNAEAQDIQISVFIGSNESFVTDYDGVNDGPFTTDKNIIISIPTNTTSDILRTQVQIDYTNNAVITSTRFIDIIQQP
jgi:hypothetical protein